MRRRPYKVIAPGVRLRACATRDGGIRCARRLMKRAAFPLVRVVFACDGRVVPEWEWSDLYGEHDWRAREEPPPDAIQA